MYIDEELGDFYEEAWDEEVTASDFTCAVRAWGMMNGSTSLGEAAAVLRSYAEWLEEKEFEGWRLRSPIEEDYGDVYQVDINGNEILDAVFE